MSAPKKQITMMPMLALLGALAFNLSSFPGSREANREVQSTDMSSLSGCLERKLSDGSTAKCTISAEDGKVRGDVEVKKVKTTRVTGTGGAEKSQETEVYELVKGELKAGDALKKSRSEDDLETEVECADCVRQLKNSQYDSIEDVYAAIKDESADLLAKTEAEKLALKRQKGVDECKIKETDDGKFKKIADGSVAQADCLMTNLAAKDEEDAYEYFNESVRPRLNALLNSDDPYIRNQAARLLREYNQEMGTTCKAPSSPALSPFSPVGSMSEDDFTPAQALTTATCDMALFANYKTYMGAAAAQYAMANPAQQQAMALKLTQFKNQWDGYFESRGMQLNGQAAMNPFASEQLGFMNSFDANLKANFNAIVQSHKNLLESEETADASLDGRANLNGRTIIQPENPKGDGLVRGVVPEKIPALPSDLPEMPAPTGGKAPKFGSKRG